MNILFWSADLNWLANCSTATSVSMRIRIVEKLKLYKKINNVMILSYI